MTSRFYTCTFELNGESGDIIVTNSGGKEVFRVTGAEGDLVVKREISGEQREILKYESSSATLYIGAEGNEGDLQIKDGSGRTVFNFNSENAALYLGADGNEGDLILKDNDGAESIHLDGGSGDIILRNADAAEHFDVVETETVEAGMIMTLNQDGKLKPCSVPYDRKVVGVVAGAGKYRPGIIMGNRSDNSNCIPVSVLGKVSCKADATIAPIEVGDLLTTSHTTGHAMKAMDPVKSFGSIIGKALSSLKDGTGMVNMLVTLQ